MQKKKKQPQQLYWGVVSARASAKVRVGASFQSPCVGRLARGTRVTCVTECRVRNRNGMFVGRVKVVEPCVGWISTSVLQSNESLIKRILGELEKIAKILIECQQAKRVAINDNILDQDQATVLYSKTRPRRCSI